MQIKDISPDNKTKIFRIVDSDDDYDEDLMNWIVEETEFELVPYDEGHYLVVAKEVFVDETVDCYINLSTPERITDYIIKKEKDKLVIALLSDYLKKYKNENKPSIIPAIASECPGIYELYYSKNNPQVGIDILKDGLLKSTAKNVIAQDLGYIFRDENRIEEAIEAFLISEKFTPRSKYIFHELAQLYAQLGQVDKQLEYEKKFK